jgi:hypothetical protein
MVGLTQVQNDEVERTTSSPDPTPELGATNGANVMATAEERLTILRMIEQGKISAEEGARLLSALGERESGNGQASAATGQPARTFHVRVTDTVTGQSKVNVTIPVSLVRFGLRFVPESSGVDGQAILEAIDTGMMGRIVDVTDDEDGKHVEIFIQ